jgi:hypothetical protein
MLLDKVATAFELFFRGNPDRQASNVLVANSANCLVPYVFTPTKFGGWRAWFRCPGCGRRCRILFAVNTLRCPKCRRLKHQSLYEMRAFRLLERARKVRRRLAKPAAPVDAMPSGDPMPSWPRYMCWRRDRQMEQLVWRLEAQAGPPFHFVLASFPVVSWTRVDNLDDRFRDLAR